MYPTFLAISLLIGIIFPFLITSLGSSFKNASFERGVNILSSMLPISLIFFVEIFEPKFSSVLARRLSRVPSGYLRFSTVGKYPSKISSIICYIKMRKMI